MKNISCNHRNIDSTRGFTMMELLVVLVIVGLLAALVGPTLYKRINPAKQSVAQAQIENFMAALDAFFIDNGEFPTEQQGLLALREKPAGVNTWHGPYLKKVIPKDPWGNPYVYRSPGRNGGYEIIALGKDGSEGGEGGGQDIVSWDAIQK
jgi:general secretion pathway protein G